MSSYYVSGYGGAPATVTVNRTGRYVRVQKSDTQYLVLAEVQIWGSGGSGGLKYVMQDLQGSTRAVMNNNRSSSTIIARYDQMPFGEQISAGTGLRTTAQSYSITQNVRHRYASTESDDTTGLDHTWWRKYESFAGRWTSPDPYNGGMSIANPQSFNLYSYTQNNPVNFIDPTGLCMDLHLFQAIYVDGILVATIDWGVVGFSGCSGFSGRSFLREPKEPAGDTPYSQKQIKAAVDNCSRTYFNIGLDSLDPSQRGHNGTFNGTDYDASPDNSNVSVVNDVSAFTGKQLDAIFVSGGNPSGGFQNGLTMWSNATHPNNFSPYRNFTARDIKPGATTLAGVSAREDTQIWELGNSLSSRLLKK